ncbi:MAG: hypothetical protein JW927_08260 [Deltaproteobacteria bacterium]|nr:hypothetical protein [Deltaproteobacteria bacterium]
MFDIAMEMMSPEFFECWKCAALHIDNQGPQGTVSWLKAHPYPPFMEHLSFRLGNQIFFVRVEDVDNNVFGPGTYESLLAVAEESKGHACIMPMRKTDNPDEWIPDMPGWGLIDASTKNPFNPVSYVTDEKIEMTAFELHDMAVQVVKEYIEKKGYELMSFQGNPEIDPSIWFIGETKEPEYVIVRAARYPDDHAKIPENLKDIEKRCSAISGTGFFASVAMANDEQKFDAPDEPVIPLWRGCHMYINFPGLE